MNKQEIVNRSIDYILLNFEKNITIDDLSNQLHISKYYFCRIFKEITGESVYAFIKRFKMEQSAIELKINNNQLLSEIGLNYGYSSTNFSSVFKQHYHSSPSDYRKLAGRLSTVNPFYPEIIECFDSYEAFDSKVQIKELDSFYIVYERTLGNYVDLKEKWQQFIDKNKSCLNEGDLLIERFYSDPSSTTLHNNVCDLCIPTVEAESFEENFDVITGGKYAVYPFSGSVQDIFREIQGLFSIWLPKSPYQMTKKYGLTIYRRADFENDHVAIDVCIPIK
ncbi:AraC family transcriptional regulator [Enterococcus sp. BWM-S5]|uniref:AraC family transcriptional regulator n=1 Tax=Enterococcus larvae TaxID=2794352 RepID=A0ABS4CN03_9ENTE|nr:AraC family transcriptional regulator [Enterococcus larvae]